MPNETEITIYVVTGSREYEDERYFGAEAVFGSFEEAKAYVRREIAEVQSEYDTKSAICREHPVSAEYYLNWPGHHFIWKITCMVSPTETGKSSPI